MKSMDRTALQAYRERWREVARIERRELQSQSTALRWRQLNQLRRLAQALGLPAGSDFEEEMQFYRRWAVLKE